MDLVLLSVLLIISCALNEILVFAIIIIKHPEWIFEPEEEEKRDFNKEFNIKV